MNKYFPVSRASMQKQSRDSEAKYKYARVSNALARVASSPPVPCLSTGIFVPPSSLLLIIRQTLSGASARKMPVAPLALTGMHRSLAGEKSDATLLRDLNGHSPLC